MGLFGPSQEDIESQNKLVGPNQANYQVAGIPAYQQGLTGFSGQANQAVNNGAGNYNNAAANAGLGNQAAATSLIGQTAMGNGPSLARANMMAGLNTQANQLASQAMTNQGNTAGGLSQRNLLNAQANAGNAMLQNAGTASVAEQLGAQGNYASAANAQTQGQMANALNASNIGLSQNQQRLAAAQLGSQNLTAGQEQNALQAQLMGQYDQGKQQAGRDQTNLGIQAVTAGSSQLMNAINTGANLVGAAAKFIPSDEQTKDDIRQGTATDSQIGKFLHAFASEGASAGGGQQSQDGDFDTTKNKFEPGMISGHSGILMHGGARATPIDTRALARGAGGGLGMLYNHFAHPQQQQGPATPAPMSPMGGPIMGYGGSMGGGVQTLPPAYAMPQDPYSGAGGGYDEQHAGRGMSMPSDERCKMNAQGASDAQLSGFMHSMEPSTFQYKDQSFSPGQHMGVMAQDVDDSKLGNDMVSTGASGYKEINVPKALGATLASLAYLNERVDALTGKKRSA